MAPSPPHDCHLCRIQEQCSHARFDVAGYVDACASMHCLDACHLSNGIPCNYSRPVRPATGDCTCRSWFSFLPSSRSSSKLLMCTCHLYMSPSLGCMHRSVCMLLRGVRGSVHAMHVHCARHLHQQTMCSCMLLQNVQHSARLGQCHFLTAPTCTEGAQHGGIAWRAACNAGDPPWSGS